MRATPCLEFTIPKFLFFSVLTFHLFLFHVTRLTLYTTCMATLLLVLFISPWPRVIGHGSWRHCDWAFTGSWETSPKRDHGMRRCFGSFYEWMTDHGRRETPGFDLTWYFLAYLFSFLLYPGWVFSLLPRILVR